MKGLVKEEHLQDIADAIREKNGSTDTYKPSEMASAIRGISSGGDNLSDLCTGVDYRFGNLNLFGKKEIEITENRLLTGTQLFLQKVKNTTVEHITVNSTSNTLGIYEMFSASSGGDTTLKRVTLNFDINSINASYAFHSCTGLEIIDGKPLNLIKANAGYAVTNMFGSCDNLKEVRFVPNSIVYSISFNKSSLLSDDTIQSIIDGLGDMTGKTAMVLTLHADVKAKLTEEQIATITGKNWTLA